MKRYLPSNKTMIFALIGLIYLPLGTVYSAKEIYTGAEELLAKEVEYVGHSEADRLDELTDRFMAELSAEYEQKQYKRCGARACSEKA